MIVILPFIWLLLACIAVVSERSTPKTPGPAPPPAPGASDRQLSVSSAPVLGQSTPETSGASTSSRSVVSDFGYPDVQIVDEIPDVCRGEYVDNGVLKVPLVGLAAKVISIASLDLAESTFKADLNVMVAWVGDEEDAPEVQFYNLQEEMSKEQTKTKKAVHDGTTNWNFYYRVRLRGVFRQVYVLHRFPFDTQDLRVDVRVKSSCKLVPMRWSLDGGAFDFDKRAVHDEFTLVGAQILHKYLPSFKFGKLEGYDPEAAIILSVLRKPMYWVVNYGAVVSAVSTLMACTYAIKPSEVSDRLGVAMTLVLTMTTTLYLMQEKLPCVSYFTFLDVHIWVCCLALMSMTLEIGLAFLNVQEDKIEEQAERKAEFEGRWIPRVGLLWITYHIVLAFWIAFH